MIVNTKNKMIREILIKRKKKKPFTVMAIVELILVVVVEMVKVIHLH